MPLRFSSLKKLLHIPKPAAQWVSIFLLFVLMPLGVVFFYSLSIRWFKGEFQRAVLELNRKEALQTSKTIANILSESLAGASVTPSNEDLIARSMAEFIRQNPNVVGIIISDQRGRIFRVTLLPQAARSPTLQNLDLPNHSLQGYDLDWLLNLLATEQPNLEPIQSDIYNNYQGNRRVGMLTILIDRTITSDAMDLAVARMTGRLTMLLGAMAMFVALASLLIYRQQRLARRLYEKRSEVERLAYVGTLAAGLAHEIRNPLNALAMQLELLEEDVGEGAPQLVAPRLQNIRKGLAGVERTVHDFLTYATPGKQQPQMIELTGAVGALCAEVSQHTTEPRIQMECLVAPGLQAWCDSHALRQIMGNLISNALRAQKKKPDSGRLRIEAARTGPWIDITVDDAGPGVPEDQRPRIFDCFFTTQSEGTGLGLPIARRLSEMNGGTLTLLPETSPLGGARFRLRLSGRPMRLPYE